MEFTKKTQKVMECAVRLAQENHHRYFMPEHMVYGMTFDEDFCREYEAGGGAAGKLRKDLLGFLKEQAGVSEEQDGPQVTLDAQMVFRMAAEQAESSSREAVELVREAKKAGHNIHAEATPHHFSLTEEAVIRHGTLAKMNPPLRTEEDRQAIIRGLADGTIDLIATDHAPHSDQEKALDITRAPSGIIGLETALPLAVTELVNGGYLTMKSVLEKMSANPAAMYHLDAGYLAEGGPADIILVDTAATQVFTEYASKSCNTPFTGRELRGVVKVTVCGGKVVYQCTEKGVL